MKILLFVMCSPSGTSCVSKEPQGVEEDDVEEEAETEPVRGASLSDWLFSLTGHMFLSMG